MPFLILLLSLLLIHPATAEEPMRHLLNHAFDNEKLQLELSDGTLTLTLLSPDAIEALFTPAGAAPPPPSYALDVERVSFRAQLLETAENLFLQTVGLVVTIQRHPFRVSYHFRGRPLLAEERGYFAEMDHQGFRFRLAADEKFFGGGSRAFGKMDRRGEKLELYNTPSYAYEERAPLMYYSMPAVVSSKKYMLVFDNTARGRLDLDSAGDGILQFDAIGGRMAYVLIAGDSWPDLAGRIAATTGRQPFLPRWALGTFASRMAYRSQAEVEAVVARYRRENFPLDAVILDLYWFGPSIFGFMGNLDWDRTAFPRPEQMMADIGRQGVKTILITEPLILKESTNWNAAIEQGVLATDAAGNPQTFAAFFGEAGLLDLFEDSAREWFWQFYRKHTTAGVAGWWGDLGEPETHPDDIRHATGTGSLLHNAYGHEWARLVYEGFRRDFPDRRAFNLMRSGFVGTQRYGILPWSGDVNRTWGGFQPQVELALQMGLQGIGWMHSDLGGFAGDYRDAELYTRWMQFGTFQPIHRPHAHETVPAEPVFWDKKTKDILRRYVRLRYQLLPYNYTLMFENATAGLPLMRPLMYLDDRPEMADCRDTFLWGDAFLVAPVTEKGATTRTVPLPESTVWFDFWTGARHPGGQALTVPVSLEHIPVFVKAGSFVPMINPIRNTERYNPRSVQIHFYTDESVRESAGQMYDDDGKTPGAHANKQYELLRFHSTRAADQLTLHLDGEQFDYPGRPGTRQLRFVVHALGRKPASIRVDGRKSRGAVWDEATGLLTVPVRWDGRPRTVVITAG